VSDIYKRMVPPKPWRMPKLSGDPEAGTESVRPLVRIAAAENVESLVGHDPIAWAGWYNAPEPFT
jgi:hypothetical protein